MVWLHFANISISSQPTFAIFDMQWRLTRFKIYANLFDISISCVFIFPSRWLHTISPFVQHIHDLSRLLPPFSYVKFSCISDYVSPARFLETITVPVWEVICVFMCVLKNPSLHLSPSRKILFASGNLPVSFVRAGTVSPSEKLSRILIKFPKIFLWHFRPTMQFSCKNVPNCSVGHVWHILRIWGKAVHMVFRYGFSEFPQIRKKYGVHVMTWHILEVYVPGCSRLCDVSWQSYKKIRSCVFCYWETNNTTRLDT